VPYQTSSSLCTWNFMSRGRGTTYIRLSIHHPQAQTPLGTPPHPAPGPPENDLITNNQPPIYKPIATPTPCRYNRRQGTARF
jgi:hypothetical protein